jgi:hypothetical protein
MCSLLFLDKYDVDVRVLRPFRKGRLNCFNHIEGIPSFGRAYEAHPDMVTTRPEMQRICAQVIDIDMNTTCDAAIARLEWSRFCTRRLNASQGRAFDLIMLDNRIVNEIYGKMA